MAELEHQDLELESFDQMVKKAVNAKAKSALQLRSSTKEIDQNCPQVSQPANSTIAKSQSSIMKDSRMEKPKVRGTESASDLPQRSNNNELSDKAWKEMKKERRQRDQKRREGSTLTIGVNAAKTGKQ